MLVRLIRNLARLLGDERGAVSTMLVLMLIPLVGMLGMATEASSWYLTQRAAQNAADSAAMAAATNGCAVADPCRTSDPKATIYGDEAKSVATQFGFTDDTRTTVTPTKVACPDGTAGCYRVAISRKIPIYLVRIVGFNGDSNFNGGRAQTVTAISIASPKFTPDTYCALALASGGPSVTGFSGSGSPNVDFSGCKIATNGKANCNGHDWKADVSDAGGNQNNCGKNDSGNINVPKIDDPYASLKTFIPKTPDCTPPDYSGMSTDTATNKLSGSIDLSSTAIKYYCGNVNIIANTSIKAAPNGTVIVIENGGLNVPGGKTFSTSSGALTIIFTGPASNVNTPSHMLNVDGTIDIAAPKTGNWHGVAIYQDPALTTGVNYSVAGNGTTWNITGLVYMPHAAVTFKGAVGKAAVNGNDCFAFVVDTLVVKGTGNFFEQQSQCTDANLTPPSGSLAKRQALVQ
jgi:Flp pilus assembly protein TadG